MNLVKVGFVLGCWFGLLACQPIKKSGFSDSALKSGSKASKAKCYDGSAPEVSYFGAAFCPIPKGSFVMTMISPVLKTRAFGPVNPSIVDRAVTIDYDFSMQTTEVTQEQWYDVMGTTPSHNKNESDCPGDHEQPSALVKFCPNNPVENVSWEDVRDFIDRINSRDQDYRYRLPSAAEWEFAARGWQTGASPQSPAPDTNSAWCGVSRPHPVARKAANQFGLYDVLGNLWEWVSDVPPVPLHADRYVRGCGWNCPSSSDCSLNNAWTHASHAGFMHVGFRLARRSR